MTRISAALGAATAAAMLFGAAAPGVAQTTTYAHHHYDHHRHYRHYASYRRGYGDRSRCWAEHHRAANTGTVLGAVGGGLLGYGLGGGHALGALLGAGGGAVVGHQIGAHSHRC